VGLSVKKLAVRKRLKLAKEGRAVVLKSRKTVKEKRKVAKRIAVASLQIVKKKRRIVIQEAAATRVRVKGMILILPSTESGEREL